MTEAGESARFRGVSGGVRLFFVAAGILAYRLSLALYPLYRARPEFLEGPASWLLPPELYSLVASTLAALAAALLLEAALRRKWQRRSLSDGLDEAVRTTMPVIVLLPCLLLLAPGAPGVPPLLSFLLLDGRPWLATVALGGSLVLKLRDLALPLPRVAVTGALLFLALFALTPGHRFRQPYDERFGTGDEPRYVRIAASLLHDADADVSNAAEHVGRRFSPGRTAAGIAALPGALSRSVREAGRSLLGHAPRGEAVSLGGQVVRGRRGGEFYVYLPGFPLLLAAPMAIDSLVAPDRLYGVVIFCLLLAAANGLLLAKLAGLVHPRPLETLALGVGLALTPPLAAFSSQIYPEVAAAIALTVAMGVVLRETASLRRWELAGFAASASLLPWLHTKYYPLLGAVLLGFVLRHRSLSRSRLAATLGAPALALALQSLYMFDITGSFLPDALWVLNRYARQSSFFNAESFDGLYYMFLGRSEGLLVYAPYTVFALLGLAALRRLDRAAFRLSLAVLLPYLWIAASHEGGGAGGWSPPGRYLVPVMPVFALALAAWLSERRDGARVAALAVLTAASFWIGVGLLEERNFLYDRAAFLSSGAVDPSPFLGSTAAEPPGKKIAYPLLLVASLLVMHVAERRRTKASSLAAALLVLFFVAGSAALSWSRVSEWTPSRDASGPRSLRPGRTETLLFGDCEEPVLRFEGGEEPAPVRVSSRGFERSLVVPSSSPTEVAVRARPFRQWSDGAMIEWRLFRLRPDPTGARVRVEPVCRE